MTESATPKIVTRDEWERSRAELLAREKAHTHAGDELAAERRHLPMTRMDPINVVGPDGHVPLHDVFEGRRMLIVYHFMWKKGAPHHQQCEGCTHSQVAMNSEVRAYLAERDVHYAVFSSGPLNEIVAYRDFMGWTTPWYSTADSGKDLRRHEAGASRCLGCRRGGRPTKLHAAGRPSRPAHATAVTAGQTGDAPQRHSVEGVADVGMRTMRAKRLMRSHARSKSDDCCD